MKSEIIKQKIKAFLHDPLHKSLMLMQTKESHENVAQRLADIVGVSLNNMDDIKLADHLASAADRFLIPKGGEFQAKFLKQPVLTHPFSGACENFNTKLLLEKKESYIQDAEKAIQSTLEEYNQLLQKEKDDDKRTELLYWLLWRRFLEDVQDKLKHQEIKRIWHLLPADTRIPDHSLWNHLKISAALSACVSQTSSQNKADWIDTSFLLLSLGPVQRFISTARKTQDHWMGSFLLSYLTFTAMQAVIDEIGADAIIFPELYKQPFVDLLLFQKYPEVFEKPEPTKLLTPSLPNRFLAIVPTGLAKELAQKAEKAVKVEWEKIWHSGKNYFENMVGIESTPYWNNLWERQNKDFFEIYWLTLPWKKTFEEQSEFYNNLITNETPSVDENLANNSFIWEKVNQFYNSKPYDYPSNLALAYPLIYDLAEHLFGARKNLRYYQPSALLGEPSFKCSLCGEREVLHNNQPKIPIYYSRFGNLVTARYEKNKFYRAIDGAQQIREFWQVEIMEKAKNGSKSKVRKLFKSGERLCAVCASKRVAEFYLIKKFEEAGVLLSGTDFSYPSTSEMGGIMFKIEVLKALKNKPDLLTEFLNILKHLSGDEYYKTFALPQLTNISKEKELREFARIDSGYLLNLLREKTNDEIEEELEQNTEIRKSLTNSLKEILNKTKVSQSRLSSYYCYIAMDGDKMGEWVAGKRLPKFKDVIHQEIVPALAKTLGQNEGVLDDPRRVTPSIHSMLSFIQNQFAINIAREVVEEHNWGKLVYSGGDDVLAMAPISNGLTIAHQLRLAFSGYSERIDNGDGWLEKDERLTMTFGNKATASIGVVFSHHTTPMRSVITRSLQMEKRAKKFGRDALGIALLKRSGETIQTVVPFVADNNTDVVKDVLEPLYRWIAEDKVSRDFVYVLKAEQNGFSDDCFELFGTEMQRIFERKIKKREIKSEIMKEFQIWKQSVENLAVTMTDRLEKEKSKAYSDQKKSVRNTMIKEMLNLFSIIEFTAREA